MNDTDIIKDVLKMIKEDGIDQLVEAIKPALEEARADEREKIRNILNDGLLHSNEEAINRLIDYLRKNETSFDFFSKHLNRFLFKNRNIGFAKKRNLKYR